MTVVADHGLHRVRRAPRRRSSAPGRWPAWSCWPARLGPRRLAAAALGWAVVVLLLVDPGLVGDAGFQLSTVATAGLIAWATPLTERLDRSAAGDLPRWLAESLGVSLAAQAATLPIVLASFGRLAVIAPAVNLLVVPLVAPAMAAGLVALLAGIVVSLGAPSAIGAILAAPAWVALRLIVSIVEATAALPLASVTLEPPGARWLADSSSPRWPPVSPSAGSTGGVDTSGRGRASAGTASASAAAAARRRSPATSSSGAERCEDDRQPRPGCGGRPRSPS